ncbi:hypothetical protein, partial [Rhizobium rhizogenes]|uniref:hypothetical protein n=1 Tax=Rhizobium rhizogenes TaxID=359 RepID=UPI001960067A
VEKSQFMKRGGARQSACPQNSKLLPQSHSGGLKTSLTVKRGCGRLERGASSPKTQTVWNSILHQEFFATEPSWKH